LALPALTPIRIEILAALGSKTSKSGDTFPIRLAEPLVIGGRELVPAGTSGMGEVVHAKKAGGSGAAGELVLAARYLEVDGRHLKLRSLRLVPQGNSKINTVNTIMVASAASPIPVSLVGFFINGGQAVVPEGTIAEAKTAEAFDFPGARVTAPDSTTLAEAGQTGEKNRETP
jgi:protein-L-isoaspartate O-methyltransferase